MKKVLAPSPIYKHIHTYTNTHSFRINVLSLFERFTSAARLQQSSVHNTTEIVQKSEETEKFVLKHHCVMTYTISKDGLVTVLLELSVLLADTNTFCMFSRSSRNNIPVQMLFTA